MIKSRCLTLLHLTYNTFISIPYLLERNHLLKAHGYISKNVADFLFLWENSFLKCDLNMKLNLKTVVEQRWGFFIDNKIVSFFFLKPTVNGFRGGRAIQVRKWKRCVLWLVGCSVFTCRRGCNHSAAGSHL